MSESYDAHEYRYQLLPNRPLAQADVIVLPVPHERTVSYKSGTRAGPRGILDATAQLEYYEEDGRWSPLRHMGITVAAALESRADEDDGAFQRRLTMECAALPAEPLLLALGGEHSITPALTAGRMREPGTVVLLDAHADLRREYEGERHSHACPMHHVREQGHGIIMAGVRSLYEEEAARIAGDGRIDCFLDRDLQRGSRWNDLIACLRRLEGPVWLSIDMDAFNPAEVPGVGTPQPGGLSWYQAVEIVEAVTLNRHVDLRGADVVELVPEPSCVSDMVAAKLTQKIISCWGRRHGYAQRPENGSQTEVSYQ